MPLRQGVFGFTFLDVPSNNTSTVESSSTHDPEILQEWADRLAGVPPAFARERRSTISRAGGSPSALASPAPLRPIGLLFPLHYRPCLRLRFDVRERVQDAAPTRRGARPISALAGRPSSYAIRSLAQRTSANAVAANPVTSREYGILDAVGP